MEIAYFEHWVNGGLSVYKKLIPLNPTGRWKIESGPYYESRIFIEHQKSCFTKKWVPEELISFLPKEETHIFECKR